MGTAPQGARRLSAVPGARQVVALIERIRMRATAKQPVSGMPSDPEPLDPASQPPIDQYCDLVLTGGVADGVVYPWAIVELARKYRFKNIGGTSVGAMAAALTAAAEYARRRGHLSGFNEVLLKLPKKLGETVEGNTRLFSLFQPTSGTERLFRLLTGFLSDSRTQRMQEESDANAEQEARNIYARNGARGVVNAALIYWRQIALAIALIGLVAALVAAAFPALRGVPLSWFQVIVVVPVAIVILAAALFFIQVGILVSICRDLKYGLVANNFGLCNGGAVPGRTKEEVPSLIEWLHEGIQGAARKPLDQPLTFKDLWDAPGGPHGRPLAPAQPISRPRSIDLRVVTACLTHGRPYTLPLDVSDRLFFKEDDLTGYFPASVLRYLVEHAKPYEQLDPADPPKAPAGILELPTGELPVLVAARLSLSFPVLFSAVPLWAIDYEPRQECRTLRRVWFSDGGICSNFPIHMFDAAIPQWPTFGIALRPKGRLQGRSVWLPELHEEGRGDEWNRFGDEVNVRDGKRISPLDRLIGFAGAIVSTAKDWNDRYASAMPGVRDRVVYIFREKNEGGLNLRLSNADILKLADSYGRIAGRKLVTKFQPGGSGVEPSKRWSEHRWVRFNTFLNALRERLNGLSASAAQSARAIPIGEQIEHGRERPLLEERVRKAPSGWKSFAVPLPDAHANDLKRLLVALSSLEAAFADYETTYDYPYRPKPGLSVRPPL